MSQCQSYQRPCITIQVHLQSTTSPPDSPATAKPPGDLPLYSRTDHPDRRPSTRRSVLLQFNPNSLSNNRPCKLVSHGMLCPVSQVQFIYRYPDMDLCIRLFKVTPQDSNVDNFNDFELLFPSLDSKQERGCHTFSLLRDLVLVRMDFLRNTGNSTPFPVGQFRGPHDAHKNDTTPWENKTAQRLAKRKGKRGVIYM